MRGGEEKKNGRGKREGGEGRGEEEEKSIV